MITISHTQAKRLIQDQLDQRNLPDAQWAALHAHLETCPECSAYRARLASVERSLRRHLRQRWDPIDGPRLATAPALALLARERQALRRTSKRMLGAAAVFLMLVLLYVGWSAGQQHAAQAGPLPASPPVTPTPAPLPTETRAPTDYRGVIAYEYRPAGETAGEIYLLNAGGEPVNLTSHPANDHQPAWSPDGEWLAFLSNRSGKDEVYVMHVSGTHLTRLSDLPDVTWRGPLSWSMDGRLLALLGERAMGEARQNWVYLVPLDGSNAYTLGSTSGATLAVFSPRQPLLAFASQGYWAGRPGLYNIEAGRETFLPVETAESQYAYSVVDHFDWSADGRGLLFRQEIRADDSLRTELRTVVVPGDRLASRMVTSSTTPGSFPAASWTGIDGELAYLLEEDNSGCATLHVGILRLHRGGLPQVNALCVEEGLEGANWQISPKSVLVIGHEAGAPEQRGLYVLWLGVETRAERLMDARNIAGPPRLRPGAANTHTGSILAIDPEPVGPQAALPLSPLPGPEIGDLLLTWKLNDRTLIDRLAPDGSQRRIISQSIGVNQCPSWSPDRAWVAFLSDRASDNPGVTQVFVTDSFGLRTHQLTRRPFRYDVLGSTGRVVPYFDCPIWSPDGRWLAALVHTPNDFVALIPFDEATLSGGTPATPASAPRYISPATGMGGVSSVAWLPDGRLVVAYVLSRDRIVLRAFDPLTVEDNRTAAYVELSNLEDWSYVTAMASSPDGRSLALAVMKWERGSDASATFGVLVADLVASESSLPGTLPDALTVRFQYEQPGFTGYLPGSQLRWLHDGRLAYIHHYSQGRRVKAEAFVLQPEGNRTPERVAIFQDMLITAAWSEDGRWLTGITEAGRVVMDTHLVDKAQPAWVSGETSGDLDW